MEPEVAEATTSTRQDFPSRCRTHITIIVNVEMHENKNYKRLSRRDHWLRPTHTTWGIELQRTKTGYIVSEATRA